MRGNYQKFEINMTMENDGFRLWKNGQNEGVCILETYKEKRSLFLSVKNLLPSKELLETRKGEYHALLLGAEEGNLLYKDFGVFHVDGNGEGSFFQKFSGAEIFCYTHCLLVAVCDGQAEPQVIYQGETPFFSCGAKQDVLQARIEGCLGEPALEIFSKEVDETGAEWHRISGELEMPETLEGVKMFIARYHHYLLGRKGEEWYVGIPGRFLQKEQPCREEGLFLLWQPLRGGEKFFDRYETMTRKQQEEIFGYWIAGLDRENGRLKPL